MSFAESQGVTPCRYAHVVSFDSLPNSALIDLRSLMVLSCRSRASIWRDVKAGRLPKPIAIGAKTRRWRVEDVRSYLKGGAA